MKLLSTISNVTIFILIFKLREEMQIQVIVLIVIFKQSVFGKTIFNFIKPIFLDCPIHYF